MISVPIKIHQYSDDQQSRILTGSFAEDYPLSILIAEDNFVNLKLIERILYKLGYLPDAVSDGVQVIHAFSKREHNVILMDVRMPHMDGFETTRIIRQMTTKQPYIIAMTANAMSNDRTECLRHGMNDYMSKPLCIEEIINKLKVAALYCSGKK